MRHRPTGIDGHPELVDTPQLSPEPRRLAVEQPPFSERNIRRALAKDRTLTARLLNRLGYEATVRRIEREGV